MHSTLLSKIEYVSTYLGQALGLNACTNDKRPDLEKFTCTQIFCRYSRVYCTSSDKSETLCQHHWDIYNTNTRRRFRSGFFLGTPENGRSKAAPVSGGGKAPDVSKRVFSVLLEPFQDELHQTVIGHHLPISVATGYLSYPFHGESEWTLEAGWLRCKVQNKNYAFQIVFACLWKIQNAVSLDSFY